MLAGLRILIQARQGRIRPVLWREVEKRFGSNQGDAKAAPQGSTRQLVVP
jgi:hypothetical protein